MADDRTASDATAQAPSLDARGLAKHFGPTRALADVDLRIDAGEVVALLGENGSGKSTLVKILAGYHVPEPGGELRMGGATVELPVPLGGFRDIGLSFVFQDLGLANELTVVENLFVGRRVAGGSRGPIHWRRERRAANDIFARYDVALDPSAVVGRLRPTAQALLAIVRAAEELREFRQRGETASGGVLVLDEPTVFLPEHEKVFLFDLVRRVVADGTGVLFVSHDMTAVRELCDRAVILRDGEKVGDVMMRETSDAELVRLVSGHRLGPGESSASQAAQGAVPSGGAGGDEPAAPPALAVEHLSGGRLRDVSLRIARGEILGVAGLLGSGTEDLPYALFGALGGARGQLRLASAGPAGTDPNGGGDSDRAGGFEGGVGELSPHHAQELGIALVPADRKQQGAVASLPVEKNMLSLVFPSYVRGGVLRHGRIHRTAVERAETYDVRPRDTTLEMSALSGGNQQKVVLTRWLELGPRVLLLHEPTQGVDIATRAEIYAIMRARCAQGVAILWVSTDFDELAAVSHRIVICAGGVIAATLEPPFSRDQITSEVYATAARGAGREVSAEP